MIPSPSSRSSREQNASHRISFGPNNTSFASDKDKVNTGPIFSPLLDQAPLSGLTEYAQSSRVDRSGGLSSSVNRRKPAPTALELTSPDRRTRDMVSIRAEDQTSESIRGANPVFKPSPSLPSLVSTSKAVASTAPVSAAKKSEGLPRSSSHQFSSSLQTPLSSALGVLPERSSAMRGEKSRMLTPPSAFPMTPDPPSPSTIDRRGLVGVGELTTPRWANKVGSTIDWSPNPRLRAASSKLEETHGWEHNPDQEMEQISTDRESRSSKGEPSGVESREARAERKTRRFEDDQGQHVLPICDIFETESSQTTPGSSHYTSEQPPRTPPSSSPQVTLSVSSPSHHRLLHNKQGTSPNIGQGSFSPKRFTTGGHKRELSDQFAEDRWGSEGESHLEELAEKENQGVSDSALSIGLSTKHSIESLSPSPLSSAQPSPGGNSILKRESRRTSEGFQLHPSPHPFGSTDSRRFRERERSGTGSSNSGRPISNPSSPAHEIVRQFSHPNDFSHLPPSPSTSSIKKLLRQGSNSNIHNDSSDQPPLPPLPNSLPSPKKQDHFRMDSAHSSSGLSQQNPSKVVDPETLEALRKLDGIGRSPSAGKRQSTRLVKPKSSDGIMSKGDSANRSRTPPPPSSDDKKSNQGRSGRIRASMPAMLVSQTSSPKQEDSEVLSPRSISFGPARASIGASSSTSSKHGSSISTSAVYSTAPSSNATGSARSATRTSIGSDAASSHSDGEGTRRGSLSGTIGGKEIPPVPPLPKQYSVPSPAQSNQATPSLESDQTQKYDQGDRMCSEALPTSVSAPNSTFRTSSTQATLSASPLTGSKRNDLTPNRSLPRPPIDRQTRSELSTTSQASGSSAASSRVPSKKWSFTNALHLGRSSSHKNSTSLSAPEDQQLSMSPSLPPGSFSQSSADYPKNAGMPWSNLKHSNSIDSFALSDRTPLDKGSNLAAVSRHASTMSSSSKLSAPALAGDSKGYSSSSSGSNKRLTPSSIPFFRRSSSSSVKALAAKGGALNVPAESVHPSSTPRASISSSRRIQSSTSINESATLSSPSSTTSSVRKSMLGGMGLSNMLKSSSSRRNLATAALKETPDGPITTGGSLGRSELGPYAGRGGKEQSDSAEKERPSPGRLSSIGLLGRKRGKTISSHDREKSESISIPPPLMDSMSHPMIDRKSSSGARHKVSPSLSTSSISANGGLASTRRQPSVSSHANTVNRVSRANLPIIAGSPSVVPMNGISSVAASGTIPSSASFTRMIDATPTKIPRIASRQSRQTTTPVTTTSSAPSAFSGSKKAGEMATTSSDSSYTRSDSNLSDFGVGASPNEELKTISSGPKATALDTKSGDGEMESSAGRLNGVSASASMSSFPTRVPRQLPVPPTAGNASLKANASSAANLRKTSKDMSSLVIKKSQHTPSASTTDLTGYGNTSSASTRVVNSKLPSLSLRLPSSSSSTSLSAPGPSSRSSSISPSLIEDDEAVGDEEMRQFLKRQKAKKQSTGATSSEIEALMNFPEPTEASPASTPLATIKSYFNDLSDFERREITEYSSIYYIGLHSKKRQATLSDNNQNHGYDDERGDFLMVPGDHLAYRYEIMCLLGKGSFGQVWQCRDHQTGQCVAVKVIRNKKRFHHQALVEVKILENLRKWDPDEKHYVIKMTEHFYFRNHLCIATELLSINLYELIKANSFAGFTTSLIRRFTTQLLSSLILMRQHRIVHCDLKPENVLLGHPAKSVIKVIDFGSSCFEHEKVYTYIQSRFYRSPEVILGMNYHMAIDMWSLGCILAELYTGFPIFPGENEQEQLSCIMEVLGMPDKYIIDKSSRKNLFFDTQGTARPVVNSKGKRRRPGTKTLAQVLKSDDDLFVDFISKCLTWDPDRRLKPQPALRHPWMSKRMTGPRPLPTLQPTTSKVSNPTLTSSSVKPKVSEAPKKTLNISAPTALTARVRVPHSTTAYAPSHLGTPGSTSMSSATSHRRVLTGQSSSMTTSVSSRGLNLHGLSKKGSVADR
ncbi:kinase-like protein [Phaffia rhodozyma]|uniref:dual-specificity kinase n=1 Tax=Phaffia rhodozyma TaxID=264483 RepID=A0A0F7SPL3_PHARH|nr:kinase-like protein [Phaffia rhodozyma]